MGAELALKGRALISGSGLGAEPRLAACAHVRPAGSVSTHSAAMAASAFSKALAHSILTTGPYVAAVVVTAILNPNLPTCEPPQLLRFPTFL